MNEKKYNIKYIGPILDPSGYGSAARKYIMALHKHGNNISVTNRSFDDQRFQLAGEENIIHTLIDKPINPDVKICHMTPDNIPVSYISNDGIPIISLFYWETTKIPTQWSIDLQYCNGVIAPCEHVKKLIENEGLKMPIEVVGQAFDTEFYKSIQKKRNSKFSFYSIFQWTRRKNPEGLLHAFWSEFVGHDDVELVIKTYRANTSKSEVRAIHQDIEYIKMNFPLTSGPDRHEPKLPTVRVVTEMFTSEQMRDLHYENDCFMMLSRGEGFCLPVLEAMSMEKPCIVTKAFAFEDYITNENAYPVNYMLTPVNGMKYLIWYDGTMNWAESDISQVKRHMRYVYENRDEADRIGIKAREAVVEKYSMGVVGEKFTEAIEKIISKNHIAFHQKKIEAVI